MSIKKGCHEPDPQRRIVTEGLLNMVEMAFRAYDPCFGCATHSLPGQMPLEVTIRDAQGNPLDILEAALLIANGQWEVESILMTLIGLNIKN